MDHFREKASATDVDLAELRQAARTVLDRNRQRGISDWDDRPYDFVCPSASSYPFQWFWDSAFHAVALLNVDSERAKQELRCLLQAAQPDGFIPHMVLWERQYHRAALDTYSVVLAHPFFTATIQPPVIARALWRVFQATNDREFLTEALPPVVRFFEWLAAKRDPDGDGLIAVIQPDESGLDASPKYDELMDLEGLDISQLAEELPRSMNRLFRAYEGHRSDQVRLIDLDRFNWVDVMVNSIYADGLHCLADLCDILGLVHDAERLGQRFQVVRNTLVAKCWDDGAGVFWDLQGREQHPARVLTFTSLFPVIIQGLDRAMVRRLVEDHLLNEREFWLPFPVPSVAASEPSFDPTYQTHAIWRGPTWVNINWYLMGGLREHGYEDVADELARRTLTMVFRGGMREFFNPYTAQGHGAQSFGWTTLILDMISNE